MKNTLDQPAAIRGDGDEVLVAFDVVVDEVANEKFALPIGGGKENGFVIGGETDFAGRRAWQRFFKCPRVPAPPGGGEGGGEECEEE